MLAKVIAIILLLDKKLTVSLSTQVYEGLQTFWQNAKGVLLCSTVA